MDKYVGSALASGGGSPTFLKTSSSRSGITDIATNAIEKAVITLAQTLNVNNWVDEPLEYGSAKVVGHRGVLYDEPENSVEGFLASARIGCDAVELDVFLLKCNTLIVFHGDGSDQSPGWLDDYCNVHGNILDYTFEEVQNLKLNPNCLQFAAPGEKIVASYIPTLEEVLLSLQDKKMAIKIELKGPDTAVPTLEMVERLDMVDRVHFSSFNHDNIKTIRDLHPERNDNGAHVYKTGALFSEPPINFIDIARSVDASEVHLKYDTCSKERVEEIHAAGMGSMAWFRGPKGMHEDTTEKYFDVGNEDESMYQTVLQSGVQALCVNKPEVLLKLLGRNQGNNEGICV
eukprot:CAMPEP_0116063020 /NCGR_PEP_ID=MMETSP0322-20121206/8147_1 /TAXON_ID=163516 /ORGANISM="Leptocylindrus danicus var. apora, Strain B651" /LENGTH=344 /DNA_ID=CAMNT_0003548521 /DNA_START=271 /DNA_END=1305 /DNA_ORIENTATION=-